MAKEKSVEVLEKGLEANPSNPLLFALKENDKKHLFETNVASYFHKTGFHLFDYYFGSVINIHDESGNIIGQEQRVGQAAGTFNLFVGNSGSGKAEPVSTLIPTPKGPVRMGDITPGMEVFNQHGERIKVTAVFPHKNMEILKVKFSDGRSTLCTFEHLWEVHHYNWLGRDVSEVKDVDQIMKDYKRKVDGENKYKYWIPRLIWPVQYYSAPCPIDPYILGGLFQFNFSTEDKYAFNVDDFYYGSGNDMVNIAANIAKRSGFDFRVFTNGKDLDTVKFYSTDDPMKEVEIVAPYSVEDDYKSGYVMSRVQYDDIFKKKNGIPDYIMYNDVATRQYFVTGFLDMDASIARYHLGDDYSIKFYVADEKIREQMVELIRSLGFAVEKDEYRTGCMHICGYYEDLLKLLTPGTDKYNELKKLSANKSFHHDKVYITDITFSHMEDAQCIMVDDSDHLYLSKDFVVTHNTTWAAQIAGNIIRQYKYANVIHFDCENRFEISRCETITKLPSWYFHGTDGARYMIKTGKVGLDIIQEMIVKTYVSKMHLKDKLYIKSGAKDEFNNDIYIFEPTVIIIDSITTVLNETFNPDSAKEASDAEKMRGNTEGARDAKSLKGFFKDIIPLCKEANIIIFGINHINQNMSMNAFIPVAKQQNYLKQDEIIPGGKTMIYYPFNIVKLTAKPSDDFSEEADGFAGHIVMVEPIKSSSNQSGNNSKGISFEMVFSHKYGFDSLRSLINYGRSYGLIEGNKTRMKFKDDPSFTFSLKNLNAEKKEKPIWECANKFIVPALKEHLSFIDPKEIEFDEQQFNY